MPAPPPRQMISGRRSPRSSIFQIGHAFEISKELTVNQVIAAFQNYRDIMNAIPNSVCHIYTDGSKNTLTGHSGAAAYIVFPDKGDTRTHSCLQYTGTNSVNYAELHAVLLGLKWIAGTSLSDSTNFHFWVDSKYAFDLLTEKNAARKHFFIVQDIFQTASALSQRFRHTFTIHRISSHVETRSEGHCRIDGSFRADRLAKKATTQIGPFSTIDAIRMQILNQCAQLVQQISGLLYDSDGPSDSAESDDCSVPATAEQVSHARDSVLQPRSVSVI